MQFMSVSRSKEETKRGIQATYAISLEHNVMLLAKLNNSFLLTPRVKFDLVDSRPFLTIDQLLEMLETIVANTDRDNFAFGPKFFQRFPEMLASFGAGSRGMDEEAIHVSYPVI